MVPGKSATGTKTAISTMEMATTAPATSFMPALAASRGVSRRFSSRRSMFSTTTMASSTTRPVASVRPKSVSVLIEKPKSFTKANVPMSDTGKVNATMSTLRQPCRNRKITRITKPMASASVVMTSWIEARTASVVSRPVLYSSPGGNDLESRAMASAAASRTSSAFAVGNWKMPMPTPDCPLKRRSCP